MSEPKTETAVQPITTRQALEHLWDRISTRPWDVNGWDESDEPFVKDWTRIARHYDDDSKEDEIRDVLAHLGG